MRFKLVEDIDSVNPGDTVFLRKDREYKNEIVAWLVDTNHRFFVLRKIGSGVVLLATTSRVNRIEKEPKNYVQVKGEERDFLVELNSWGILPIDYIQRVADSVSFDDYANVVDKFENSRPSMTLKLEKLSKRKITKPIDKQIGL